MRGILGFAGAIVLTGSVNTPATAQTTAAPVEFSVSEAAAPGAAIGVVTAPGATIDVSPECSTSPFLIDGRSGEITLGDSPLDFERQSRHQLTVRLRTSRALDGARRAYLADLLTSGAEPEVLDGQLFDVVEQTIVVNVTDSPEAPVLATDSLTLVASEPEGSASASIGVVDPDSDDFQSFELIDGDIERFEIDRETGLVTWRSGAREGGQYPLTVRVTDADGLSDTVTLNVEVHVPAVVAASEPAPSDAVEVASDPVQTDAGTDAVTDGSLPDPSQETVPPEPVEIPAVAQSPVEADVEMPAAANGDDGVVPFEDVPPELEVETATQEPELAETAVAAAVVDEAADTTAAASSSSGGLSPLQLALVGVPMFLAAGVAVALLLLRRRRRAPPAITSEANAFRVVREARMLAAQTPAVAEQPEIVETAQPVANCPVRAAEKAAVHELLASAFQQTAVRTEPTAPAMPVGQPVETRAPLDLIEEVYRSAEPVVEAVPAPHESPVDQPEFSSQITEQPYASEPEVASTAPVDSAHSEEVAYESPLHDTDQIVPATIEMPLSNLPSIEFGAIRAEEAPTPSIPFNDLVATPTSAWSSQGESDEFDTETFARPAGEDDAVADVPHDVIESDPYGRIEAPAPPAEMSGYDHPDDELGGGYYGLRLSATSFGPTPDEIAAADARASDLDPIPTADSLPTSDFGSLHEPAAEANAPEPEDAKLQELRRQLSDLFGVPSERRPARTVDLREIAEPQPVEMAAEEEPEPVAPPPPAASAPVATPVEAADPSDPVSTWMAYLQQRSQEQPNAVPRAASVAPAPAAAPVVPPPPPPRPVAPAPVARVPQAAAPTAVRVNKSAVREEITMLRNVANLHSRNILARRASHQRARYAWVLWGTALVVLCFGGLAVLKQGPGPMRIFGWMMFAGAAAALGGCVHAFRNLTNRGDAADDAAEDVTALDEVDVVAEPEVMTAEMEERLRAVMEETAEEPVAVRR